MSPSDVSATGYRSFSWKYNMNQEIITRITKFFNINKYLMRFMMEISLKVFFFNTKMEWNSAVQAFFE